MPADLWANLTTFPTAEWAFTLEVLAVAVLGLVILFLLAHRAGERIVPTRLQQPPALEWIPGCNCHDCVTARGSVEAPTVPDRRRS